MDPLERVTERIAQARLELLEARIMLAQRKDGLLTEAELLVKLDVCAEFGWLLAARN